ncbi:arginase family protein [Castellaniella sp. GW247-6E4]|uniref:arginase family protein n=1 Tax=Castellaniella sp. GW247-6E4 TaxID=3140380 RepID=UPI003314967F
MTTSSQPGLTPAARATGLTSFAQPTSAASFMGVPLATDPRGARAAILGVPFDCGSHPTRIGARLGPSAIRQQSTLVRRFSVTGPDTDPIQALGLVDCGDVILTPGSVESSYPNIQRAVASIAAAGAIPITFGGDGAVTLPQLRALAGEHADLAVLHFDAHTDAYDMTGHNTATTFTRAAEEGLIDAGASIHIGARGPTFMPGVLAHTRSLGYEVIEFNDWRARGTDHLLGHLHQRLKGRPVYLCFDMDFFDPSCAPGVCAPVWGGALAGEGLALLEGLQGLNFVAFDINTVSPPHDPHGQTAYLAATVAWQCLWLALAAGTSNGDRN